MTDLIIKNNKGNRDITKRIKSSFLKTGTCTFLFSFWLINKLEKNKIVTKPKMIIKCQDLTKRKLLLIKIKRKLIIATDETIIKPILAGKFNNLSNLRILLIK